MELIALPKFGQLPEKATLWDWLEAINSWSVKLTRQLKQIDELLGQLLTYNCIGQACLLAKRVAYYLWLRDDTKSMSIFLLKLADRPYPLGKLVEHNFPIFSYIISFIYLVNFVL